MVRETQRRPAPADAILNKTSLPDSRMDPEAWFRTGEAIADAARRLQYFRLGLQNTEPYRPWARLGIGTELLARREVQEAVKILEKGVKRAPAFARLRVLLGEAYLAAGDAGKAVETLQEAVRLAPGEARAWHLLGDARVARKDARGAIQAWERAVERDETDRTAWRAIADAARATYQHAKAVAAYRQALERDSGDVEAWRRLGEECVFVDDVYGTIEAFMNVVAREPADGHAWNALAFAFEKEGSRAEQLYCLERAEALDFPQARRRADRLRGRGIVSRDPFDAQAY